MKSILNCNTTKILKNLDRHMAWAARLRGDLSTPTFARLSRLFLARQTPCFGGVEPRPTQLLPLTTMVEAVLTRTAIYGQFGVIL